MKKMRRCHLWTWKKKEPRESENKTIFILKRSRSKENRSRCPLVVAEVPRRAAPEDSHRYTPYTHLTHADNVMKTRVKC